MPTRNIGPCECCEEDFGDPVYVEVTCLDEKACETGGTATYSCTVDELPENWCIEAWTTSAPGGTLCEWVYDHNIQLDGDPCIVCGWGDLSSNNFAVTGHPTSPDECRAYQANAFIACKDDPIFGMMDVLPENGFYVVYQLGPGPSSGINVAAYWISADDFSCDSANLLDLIASSVAEGSENFPSKITVSPCGPDSVVQNLGIC